MKNFEQIRAKNALGVKIGSGKKGSGKIAKKVPVMVLDNGLIASVAFALEPKASAGYKDVFDAVIRHLADKEIGLLTSTMDLEEFIDHLVDIESDRLRLITAETMAYLNYLRRFAEKKDEGDDHA